MKKNNNVDFKKADLSPVIRILRRVRIINKFKISLDLLFNLLFKKKAIVINPKLKRNVPTTFSS